jgi:Uma2 family endonuclease
MRRGIDGLKNLGRPPVKKPLPTVPISFEEFLDWCDEDTRAEWVNGRVVLMSPASSPHQQVLLFLAKVLGIYVEERRLGQLLPAPFVMKLENVAREPDLMFIPTFLEPFIHRTFFEGPAGMVVEVISPESADRDRVEKFAEYAQHGVDEYWLIDADAKVAEFYRLSRYSRQFEPLPVGEDGIFKSKAVEGFFLRLEWLWNAPPTFQALQELGVIVLSDGSDGGR